VLHNLLDRARSHFPLAAAAERLTPFEFILLTMLLEQRKEIEQLKDKADSLSTTWIQLPSIYVRLSILIDHTGRCTMKKHPILLWTVAFILAWIFDFLFWKKPVGINLIIFLAICLIGGFSLLLGNSLKPARGSLWLLIPFVFFAAITCLRQEPLTYFLACTFMFVSLGLLTVTFLGGRWTHYGLSDYFRNLFQLVVSIIVRPIEFHNQSREEMAAARERIKSLPLKSIARGLLIAIPIVIFFTILLASGDLIFHQKIVAFFASLRLGRVPEYILRLVIILILAYALTGIFLHAAWRSKDEVLLGEDKPIVKRRLGFIEAAIILGGVIVLFLSFVIVQFRYFFGGEVNIGVNGFTYSQYARSGFNELIAVAFFSLLMILGLSTITKRENNQQKRIYSGLSIALIALVIVILASAYQRLSLAIDWHGFSRLRLYPRIFLIWVGILFVAVIVLEIVGRERFFALAAILASFGFAVSLGMVNVDASIAEHNVNRAVEGKHFNVSYLTSLSADAVPALTNIFMDPTLPVAVHEGVGAALFCYLHSPVYEHYSVPDWRSFNYPRWEAFNALKEIEPYLFNYNINESLLPVQVETPSHEFYVCANEY